MRLALLGFLLLGTCGLVQAHDYWLEVEGDDYILFRGHRHSGHRGEDLVPYDPAIVTRALCAEASGTVREVQGSSAYPIRIPGPCAVVLVEADSGTWSHTYTGSQRREGAEPKSVTHTWRALETVKRLNSWGPGLGRPLSQGLEITSPKDPMGLAPGEKLRLIVTQDGRPRAGVSVAYDGDTRGVTGANGLINLKVRHGGTQVITASLEEPDPQGGPSLLRSTVLLLDLKP
jgi:nickel transport protein